MLFRLLSAILIVIPSMVSAQKSLTAKQAADYAQVSFRKMKGSQEAAAKSSWEQKEIRYDSLIMRFDYKVFGEKPKDGRSLYISLHGGGNAPAPVNDQQWENQKGLYKPAEGVYVAPRAPTNTWNMWHESHIDIMLDKLIFDAVVNEGVNPDKVYLMGYSAGGDGVFQLAPRLADRLAAAAMMAGHPGDAQVVSLRNLPFTLFVGGQDAAYNRNGLVKEWGHMLDSLQALDTAGYKHDLHIYAEHSHWMFRKDTIALPWMAKFKRNPLPSKIVWKQDDRTHTAFYWLETTSPVKEKEVIASIKNNVITIEKNDCDTLIICLNDKLINLDKKVQVNYLGKQIFNGKIVRDPKVIDQTVQERKDPAYIFSAKYAIINGQVNNYVAP
jgi:pimeloyl-ACP methyl ester carboxylesterase